MLLPTSRAARTILGRNQRPTAKATPSNASRVTWLAISEGERSTMATPTRAATRIAHLVDSSGRVRRAYVVEAPGYFAEMVLDDLEAMGDCDPNE